MNIKDLGNRAVLTRSAGSRIGRDTALLCARLVICGGRLIALPLARAASTGSGRERGNGHA